MFVPERMRQVRIIAREEDVEQLAVALGRLGTLDLLERNEVEGWAREESDDWSGQSDRHREARRQLRRILDELGISAEGGPKPDTISPSQDIEEIEEGIQDVQESISDWRSRKEAVEDGIERLQLLVRKVEALSPLDFPVEQLLDLTHLHTVVGTIPQSELDRLHIVLFRIPFVLIPLHQHDGSTLLLAASAAEDRAVLDRALSSAMFERLQLPEQVTGPPSEALDELQARLEDARDELQELEHERQQRAKELSARLLDLWSRVTHNAAVVQTIRRFGHQGGAYLIAGWVPLKDLDELVETVDSTTVKVDIEVLDTESEQRGQTPVLLRSPALLAPFERIVSIFGYPAYDQINPTPIVALTFILMFGMMFGDLGHGLLVALAGVGLIAWRRGRYASMATVLIAAGISGSLFGILYGSLFGYEEIIPHLWLSPLDEVMPILIASLVAGVAMLNVGFLLHLASAWRSRDWGSLLLSENGVAGLLLYWSLLGGGVLIAQGVSLPIPVWIAAVVMPMLVIMFSEPLAALLAGQRPTAETGWVTYSVQSFFILFESLIAYFTNTISFVRLGAFAVGHAALSRVVGTMAGGMGGPGRWVVIALGTIVIVGFEGMVIAIQTLRLEYYEFFDKFFHTTGRRYHPFRLKEAAAAVAR